MGGCARLKQRFSFSTHGPTSLFPSMDRHWMKLLQICGKVKSMMDTPSTGMAGVKKPAFVDKITASAYWRGAFGSE
jgi:hypothetical protein